MGVRADVEGEHAVVRQRLAHGVDGGVGGEGFARRPQRCGKVAPMRWKTR